MNNRQQRVQVLYEIAMSIGRGESLEATAREALSTYLRKLNCTAGAVLERRSGSDGTATYERVASVPARPSVNAAYEAGLEWLETVDDEAVPECLPKVLDGEDGRVVSLYSLPEFGVLVLVNPEGALADDIRPSLTPLNQKLADACRAERAEQQVRRQRNRFEAMFETLPDPAVYTAEHDGRRIVEDVNPAFADRFSHDRDAIRGEPVETIIKESTAATASGDGQTSAVGVEREVERETEHGQQIFTVRTAAPSTNGRNEQFRLYIDVTDQRERVRTLDRLYHAAEGFIDAPDVATACDRAAETAAVLLDFSVCRVYRYDRDEQALVSAASGGDAVDGTLPARIGDHGSPVWKAYRNRERTTIDTTTLSDGADAVPVRGELLVLPLGSEGVLLLSTTEATAVTDADRYFGRLLATMLRTAVGRLRREQKLQAVQQTTSDLVTATDAADVSERLIDRATAVFDLPIVAVWQFDRAANRLEPIAQSAAARSLLGDAPAFNPGESIAWQVFEAGEPRMVADLTDSADAAHNADSPLQSEVIVPLGEFGVLVAGSPVRGDFSETEFELLQTLATSATSAIQLAQQRKELRLSDQIQSRVLRHNIRNALNVIEGHASSLVEDEDEEVRAHAETIAETSGQLLSTAQNTQTVRKVFDHRNERAEFDVESVLGDAVGAVTEEHPAADVVVEETVDASVSAHPELFDAFRNIVENAIKHADTDSPRVVVRVSETPGAVHVEVSDDGPGIPAAEIQTLRTGEETDLQHGSGVGLWIIDRVVRYSGGTVEFDSGDDGTTVTVQLTTE